MTKDTIRVGIIGAGANTRLKHIPGLRSQNSVELVGLANRTEESSRKAAKELDIPKVYPDWKGVIADPNVDAVCIGTWPYTHAEMTIAALDAGKHVLCEARMAMNAREAHAMLAASRRNPQLIAQIVPAPMSLPVDRTIADTIADGAIGNIIAADVRISTGDYPNAGCAAALAAEPRPLRQQHHGARHLVRADDALDRPRGERVRGRPGGGEASPRCVGHAGADLDSGSYGRGRHAAAGRPVSPGAVVGGRPRAEPESRRISSATRARSAFITPLEGEVYLTLAKKGGNGAAPLAIDAAKRGAWRVEEEFVNAIRGREPVTHTDFVTGTKYMEWTDAVAQSMRERREVALPLAF